MAQNDTFVDSVVKGLAVIGGAFMAAELLKAFATKEVVYSCPHCRNDIKYGVKSCPFCCVALSWEGKTGDEQTLAGQV